MITLSLFFLLALLPFSIFGIDPNNLGFDLPKTYKDKFLSEIIAEGISVNLTEPTYTNGVLTTEKGGIITGPNIRIQARKIIYTRKKEEKAMISHIYAEGDLMVEFSNTLFVGDSLEYDFQNKSGTLHCGRTAIKPWFIGGDVIELHSNGNYLIHHVYITTSESKEFPDWTIKASSAFLEQERFLTVKQVQFRIGRLPLFWIPSFQTDLTTLDEHPLRYTAGWGGRQGPRLGIAYELISWNRWKVYARFDYRLRRGPGGGFETYYSSPDHKQTFESINYIARDVSIFNKHERTRFRLQGVYTNSVWDDKLSLHLAYDKLSDEDMASDYDDQSLELEPSGRTELEIRRQEEKWIANFFASVRINSFETLKQELPTLYTTWRPFSLGRTGIISENELKCSYLSFVYANDLPHTHPFSSSRLAGTQRLYRPFISRYLRITPELMMTEIFYGNSPGAGEKLLLTGKAGCDVNTSFYRYYDDTKHILVPYLRYSYFTMPTISPKKHYIFDIEDGWFELNTMRVGLSQRLYHKDCNGLIRSVVLSDIYGYGFIHVHHIPTFFPKIYSRTVINPNDFLQHTIEVAWNFSRDELEHLNLHTLWTVSADFAVSAEYRHRDAYDWRKVDRDNFILDSYRSFKELRHSSLSDRRDTALLHFFLRYHPNWAVEFESLWGWNRKNHSRYNEFEVNLLGSLPSAAEIKIAYQHRESDDRVAIYFSLGARRADRFKKGDYVP